MFVFLCVKDGAFCEFKKAFRNNINLIISIYSTASRCLGSLIEFMNHQNKKKKNFDISSYSLIIDEANLLLNNISLIEIIHDFLNVVFWKPFKISQIYQSFKIIIL